MNQTKKQKLLITGASGFIGRNLFEYFESDPRFSVIGTYHTNKTFAKDKRYVQADLTNKQDVDRVMQGVDILIQAAATTSGANDIVNRPYLHVTNNAIMNALLFQAAYDQNVPRVVFFSCTAIYPNLPRPVKETDLDLVNGVYEKYFGVGWTKIYIEKLCEFYARLNRTKFTVIRHSNIYGPYDKFDLARSHVFGATITKVMQATDQVTVWGKGQEERDLLYVSDLMKFVDLSLDKQKPMFDVFNVGLGKSISIDGLVKKIIKHSGKKIAIHYDTSKPTIATKLACNINKARKTFGWRPQISIDDGITKTIAWHKKNVK